MRFLSFLLILSTILHAHAVSKNEVRRRFVLSLLPSSECDDLCVENVQETVKTLRFHSRPAKCRILRYSALLRMLTVRCGIVTSPKTAMLLNARFKAIPGVRTSTPDALVSTEPSNSKERDEDEGQGPDTPWFRPASRMSAAEGLLPYNWGLDRIDEDYSPLDNVPVDFSCYPNQGAGVRIFLIDTGCRPNHAEFVNATIGTCIAPGSKFKTGWDNNGHGTHIAGVIVGKNVGVARNANLTCIKAFDKNGNGAATDMISATEYIVEEKAKNPSVPFIVNLSYSALTGFTSTALDEIVYSASAYGILFVVSAGNAAVNSCLFSPSKAEQALTVTASTKRDSLEVDSNIGPCVEFIAPGHDIVSAGIASKKDYQSLNGTSMAVPHVVGLSALVLAENLHLQESPETVRDNLYQILVMTRSVNVANYIMPLMETGCTDRSLGVRTNASHPTPSPPPPHAPSPSPSLSATPSASTMPSPSPSASVSPSYIPEYKPGDKRFNKRRGPQEISNYLPEVSLEEASLEEASPEQASPEQSSPEQSSPEQLSPEQLSPEQLSPEPTSPEPASAEPASPKQVLAAELEATDFYQYGFD